MLFQILSNFLTFADLVATLLKSENSISFLWEGKTKIVNKKNLSSTVLVQFISNFQTLKKILQTN